LWLLAWRHLITSASDYDGEQNKGKEQSKKNNPDNAENH
jgi:hypothetical protein